MMKSCRTWGLALLLVVTPAVPKDRAEQDARLKLIRALSSEFAVTKVPLPRGKRGIFLDPTGKLDQEKAKLELQVNGVALQPGVPVKITKVSIKEDRVVYEINGGGKRAKKWYQRIEIGMGTHTAPVAPDSNVPTYGSWITVVFPGATRPPTVEEAKKTLNAVLDFERHSPTVLYSPDLPEKFKAAIRKHQVLVGMNRDAVLSSKGPPDRKVREVRDGVEQEDWIYGLPPQVIFVTFEGDTVVAIKDHTAQNPTAPKPPG